MICYRCAVTQYQGNAALFRAQCIPQYTVLLCKILYASLSSLASWSWLIVMWCMHMHAHGLRVSTRKGTALESVLLYVTDRSVPWTQSHRLWIAHAIYLLVSWSISICLLSNAPTTITNPNLHYASWAFAPALLNVQLVVYVCLHYFTCWMLVPQNKAILDKPQLNLYIYMCKGVNSA